MERADDDNNGLSKRRSVMIVELTEAQAQRTRAIIDMWLLSKSDTAHDYVVKEVTEIKAIILRAEDGTKKQEA